MRSFFYALIFVSSFFLQKANCQRAHINFDDNWKFSFGHTADPSRDFNYGLTTIFAKTGAAAGNSH
jgi:beta-galactosidase